MQWPFGSFLPEETSLRKEINSHNSNLVILFHIGKYLVAIQRSADVLSRVGLTVSRSVVRSKNLRFIILKDDVSIQWLLEQLPKTHIAITKVLL